MRHRTFLIGFVVFAACFALWLALSLRPAAANIAGCPMFPTDNVWNARVDSLPVHSLSTQFVNSISANKPLHPDFGGFESPGSVGIHGFPYVVVPGNQPKKAVQFYYGDESDGVDHATGRSYPFYPIPDEAITQPYWIEGGPPGNTAPGGDFAAYAAAGVNAKPDLLVVGRFVPPDSGRGRRRLTAPNKSGWAGSPHGALSRWYSGHGNCTSKGFSRALIQCSNRFRSVALIAVHPSVP